jgi:hypothetical protein
MTDARVTACSSTYAFDWIDATHFGYAPARHRRTVVRTVDSGWLIVDVIDGDGRHSAAARWHFDPAWQVMTDGSRVHAGHPSGDTAWMLCAGGDVAHSRGGGTQVYRNALTAFLHGEGWCAPVYGQLVPTSTIRLSTDANAPLTLVTWLGSGRTFHAPKIRCADALGDGAVIVEVVDGSHTIVFMVQPADSSRPRHLGRPVEIETDAAMLAYSTENGHLQRLIAQGTAGCPFLLINGLDLPLVAKSTTDTVLIHGSDWLSLSAGKAAPSAIA